MRPGRASSLLPSDVAAGQRLACSALLEQDDSILFDYASDPAAPRTAKAFVNVAERVSDDVMRLELELADNHWLDFSPGQFVNITPPGTSVCRSYSMSSTPSELPKLEFYVRLLERGVMTDYLRNAVKPDDVLTLEGPHGRFILGDNNVEPLLFIAGGTGLSPILALVKKARNRKGRKPPMLLSFGCATSNRLFASETLELLADLTPTLDVRISVEDGSVPSHLAGNPLEALAPKDIQPEMTAFICGPPAMVASAHTYLMDLGMPAQKIHYEQFTPTTDFI